MAYVENYTAWSEARARNIWNNANKTFHRTFERSVEVETWLINIENDRFWSNNEFAMSLYGAWSQYGKLTEGQYNAVCKIIDKAAARQAEWDAKREADKNAKNATLEHVGVVGERMQFELTVKAIIEYDRPQFYYNDSGIGYLTIMEDAAGNKVVYMNALSEKRTKDNGMTYYMPADKGDTVLFMAKVKEHGVRDGAKQTIVQRPTKIVVVKGEE